MVAGFDGGIVSVVDFWRAVFFFVSRSLIWGVILPEKSAAAVRYYAVGVVFALLASVGFSTKAILVKLAYQHNVDAVTLLALRMLFSFPFFLIAAYITQRDATTSTLTRRDWSLLATLGLIGYYVSSLFDFWGLEYITASLERLIIFLYPTFVVLLSAALARERISRQLMTALAVCYAGIVLVYADEGAHAQRDLVVGSALVFVSVISYACYLVASGQLIQRIGSLRFTAYGMTFSCIGVIVHFLVSNPLASLRQPKEVYGAALAMAIFATVLPAFFLAEGMKRIGAGSTAVVGSFGPVATIALAYWLLGESLTTVQVGGSLLVIVGVLIIGKQK